MDTKTILIVDDDLPFAETLEALLIAAGYRTIVAKDGEEAGVEVEINPLDLILADVLMPVSNGLAFCRRVCANDATHHTPIILMSAMPATHFTIPVQIADFLVKPFDMDALLRLVVSIIGLPTPRERAIS